MDAHQVIAGRYTLQREIGRGGSGVVHLATDELLGRSVAVKRLGLSHGAQQPDLERAEREARLAAALNHPHVVAVYDLVEEGDAHWLVMEYVEGETLADLSRAAGGLPHRRAADLVGQAAAALADAHASGMVHRDVKPSNILVSADDQAKLTDFGIARAKADVSLTQTGLVTGSPAYLAPEVASGSTASQASDVWSLGATLYATLTGGPPYDIGDNLVGGLYRIVHEEPPRYGDAGPLAAVLAASMVRDPGARWSMAQVRDELMAVARGGAGSPAPPAAAPTVAAAPAPVPRRTEGHTEVLAATSPRQRRSTPWGWLAIAALLLVAVGATVYFWPGDGARPTGEATSQAPTDTPSDPTSEASPDPEEDAEQTAEEMTVFINDYLATVSSDSRAAFDQLTPAFQSASGGYDGYMGWWGTVRSATPRNIEADPEALTVDYTVDYVMKNGDRDTQQVSLQLERQDDGYLIAGEA